MNKDAVHNRRLLDQIDAVLRDALAKRSTKALCDRIVEIELMMNKPNWGRELGPHCEMRALLNEVTNRMERGEVK